jgi:hypothetical protein
MQAGPMQAQGHFKLKVSMYALGYA